MAEHMLISEIEIITDAGLLRRWSAAEKLRIVEEKLDERVSVMGVVAAMAQRPICSLVGGASCLKEGASP